MKQTKLIIKNTMIFLAITLSLTSCVEAGGAKTFSSLSDFSGADIGTINGTISGDYIDSAISGVVHKSYNTFNDLVEALSSGKVDAISFDLPVAKYLTAQRPEFVIFPETVETGDKYGFALAKDSPLTEKGDEIFQKLIESGTIDELKEYWFSTGEGQKKLPVLDYKDDYDGSAGTIRYGFDTALAPLCYEGSNGEPLGLELDIISRIAYELNMKIEFVSMNFDAFFISLSSGKVDIAGGSISITEQRLESYDFIGPYNESSAVLIIKKENLAK